MSYSTIPTPPLGSDPSPSRSPAGSEDFLWDGLALIRRGDERFVNEPHVGGGNPVASSKGTTYFNDILGTTVGAKSGAKYTPAALTAFGETFQTFQTAKHQTSQTFFTGKPEVAGLGHAFLFRNYRASLAKWQTADPLGYPDGWNQLAYCRNDVIGVEDICGAKCSTGESEFIWHEYRDPIFSKNDDGIHPIEHPSIPPSTNNNAIKDALRMLNGLTVSLGEEVGIYSSTWEHLKSSDIRTEGNYEYQEEYYLRYEISKVDHFAYYSKSSLLDAISGSCATAGAAAAIVPFLFPQLVIPAGYIGSTASVVGFVSWLSGALKGNDCKTLLFTDYNGKWLDELKTEFWHRRIE